MIVQSRGKIFENSSRRFDKLLALCVRSRMILKYYWLGKESAVAVSGLEVKERLTRRVEPDRRSEWLEEV